MTQNANMTGLLMVLSSIVLILTAYTVPINATMDVYIDYKVEKPLSGTVYISNLNAVAHGHTIMTSPLSGASVLGVDLGIVEDVFQSGTITVYVKAGNVTNQKEIGNIIRTTGLSGSITLTSVPKDQKEILVSIYEDRILKETQKVVLR